MQWKFTPGALLLAIVCFAFFPAYSQVTSDTTIPAAPPTDTIPSDTIPVTTQPAPVNSAADTVPTSVDPELLELSNSRNPREYTISAIKISGTKYLDEQLLISISGLSVGDKVMIPGGDDFSKAILNLWRQNLFANIQIFFTRVYEGNVEIEISVTERPRLSKYIFKGTRKSDAEELGKKTGLVPGRVVTENTKRSAVEAIKKYYTEKGYRGADVTVDEVNDPTKTNTVTVIFNVNRGPKVRINEVSFYGNESITDIKLKKQMKGTKEMTKITLHPSEKIHTYGTDKETTFKDYLADLGFLSITKTKEFLDPYFRFKLFSSAKFNETKYEEDKDKVLQYYN
jgi:outer membrane protein insertion porin family